MSDQPSEIKKPELNSLQQEASDTADEKKIITHADLAKEARDLELAKTMSLQAKTAENEDDEEYVPLRSQLKELPETPPKPDELKEYSQMVAQQLQLETDSDTARTIADADKKLQLNSLPDHLIQEALLGLKPKEIFQFGDLSKDMQLVSRDKKLWQTFLRKDAKSENPISDFFDVKNKNPIKRAPEYWPLTKNDPDYFGNHNSKDYDPSTLPIKLAKFFMDIVTNYENDSFAILRLISCILRFPKVYAELRTSNADLPDEKEEYIKELFSRWFNLGKNDLGKSFYNLGTIFLSFPTFSSEYFEKVPELIQVMQKLAGVHEPDTTEEPDELAEHTPLSNSDIAIALLNKAAEFEYYQAKILIAALEFDKIDSDLPKEKIIQLFQEARKSWLNTQKHLTNSSESEKDYAFVEYAYQLLKSTNLNYFKKSFSYLKQGMEKIPQDAISSVNQGPMPKWLKIILKNDPRYVTDGLSKRLGINIENFDDEIDIGKLYFQLAKNIFEKRKQAKKSPTPTEEHDLLMDSMPHVDMLLRQSAKLGYSQANSLHKALVNQGELTPLAWEISTSSGQLFFPPPVAGMMQKLHEVIAILQPIFPYGNKVLDDLLKLMHKPETIKDWAKNYAESYATKLQEISHSMVLPAKDQNALGRAKAILNLMAKQANLSPSPADTENTRGQSTLPSLSE
ncbi:MAG TPA: hypothetical protein VHE99_08870 [Gammaproteobacteria bacterium]|nr:hypothetical protein [Gammaproteobacteria bacterium]